MSKKPDSIEPSKNQSWVWIAFTRLLSIAAILLLMILIWSLAEGISIAEIVKKIQEMILHPFFYILAILWGFIYLGLSIRERAEEDKWERFQKSIEIPGFVEIGDIKITVENDSFLLTDKGSPKKDKSRKLRKSDFKEVRLSHKYIGYDDDGVPNYIYYVELLHMEQSTTINICKEEVRDETQINLVRQVWKETARTLKLPAVE